MVFIYIFLNKYNSLLFHLHFILLFFLSIYLFRIEQYYIHDYTNYILSCILKGAKIDQLNLATF